ncbi:hypothetical protein ACJX0J_016356, partial [Zea mays]
TFNSQVTLEILDLLGRTPQIADFAPILFAIVVAIIFPRLNLANMGTKARPPSADAEKGEIGEIDTRAPIQSVKAARIFFIIRNIMNLQIVEILRIDSMMEEYQILLEIVAAQVKDFETSLDMRNTEETFWNWKLFTCQASEIEEGEKARAKAAEARALDQIKSSTSESGAIITISKEEFLSDMKVAAAMAQ